MLLSLQFIIIIENCLSSFSASNSYSIPPPFLSTIYQQSLPAFHRSVLTFSCDNAFFNALSIFVQSDKISWMEINQRDFF